ncbi:alpha/beta hydrolase [Yoonia sp. SS1-5]|uniref:Alpha/beta hydrolase n=1 Tax=Yoonia rhodophyticola TaxID=3137370 RepID=A0AAN0NH18_9RHOB
MVDHKFSNPNRATVLDQLMGFGARCVCRLPEPLIKRLAGPAISIDGQKLDPLIQLTLRWFADPPGKVPELHTLRRTFDIQATWLSKPLDPSIGIRTIQIDGPHGAINCEVHQRVGQTSPAPAFLFFHGGGHSGGSLMSHRPVAHRLAKELCCTVFAIDYRLAPENPFPVGIEDCLAAYDHIADHAQTFGIDPRRIIIGGDSAGANVTAVLAQQRRDAPIPPALQVLWVPWMEMRTDTRSYELFDVGYFLEKPTMDWYIDNYVKSAQDAENPKASPLLGTTEGLCPAVVLIAGFDPLRDEGLAYAQKLQDAGVTTHVRVFDDLVHPMVNLVPFVPAATRAWDETMTLIKASLSGEHVACQ